MVGMEQVHGCGVVRVDKSDNGRLVKNCDSLISNDPDIEVSIRVADCLPIFLIDKKSRTFGLIHAGWRGLQKQIIAKTVKKMAKDFSSNPNDLEVSIGPHICWKHYEVKRDVSSKFLNFSGSIIKKSRKEFLDLAKVANLQLISVGVNAKNIKIDKRCTFEDKNLFSFRGGDREKRNVFKVSFKYPDWLI